MPVQEQWTILAAAAGATGGETGGPDGRIGLGTFVANVVVRHPALLARMAATLQAASGGRFVLGLGIGSGGRDLAAHGIESPPVDERVARLEEAVAAIRALWTGGPVTRPSPFYPLDAAHAFPVPEPRPPILIGAQSRRGVDLAARIGDGWAAEEPHFGRLLPAYLEALEASGRGRGEARVVVGFGGGRSGVDALAGSPWVERPSETWAELRAQGADEAVVTARTTRDVDRLVEAADRW